MSNLQLFRHNNGRELRVIRAKDDAPWFVALDVARMIGCPTVQLLLSNVEDGDHDILKRQLPPGELRLPIVNRPALNAIVLRSRCALARQCEHWVDGLVLPGFYSVLFGFIRMAAHRHG